MSSNSATKEELMQRTLRNILFAEDIWAVPTKNRRGLYCQLYAEPCPNHKIEVSVYFEEGGYIELKEYYGALIQGMVHKYLKNDHYRAAVYELINFLNLNRWVLMQAHDYGGVEAPSFSINEEGDFNATYVLSSDSVSFPKLLTLIHITKELMEKICGIFVMVITGGISVEEAKQRLL